jgi:hypothetical protein
MKANLWVIRYFRPRGQNANEANRVSLSSSKNDSTPLGHALAPRVNIVIQAAPAHDDPILYLKIYSPVSTPKNWPRAEGLLIRLNGVILDPPNFSYFTFGLKQGDVIEITYFKAKHSILVRTIAVVVNIIPDAEPVVKKPVYISIMGTTKGLPEEKMD